MSNPSNADMIKLTWREFAIATFLCACMATLFLARPLFTNTFVSPADVLFNYYPWHSQAPENWQRASNGLLIDSVDQMEPWLIYTAERLHSGEIPLWNDKNMLGAPFLANMQSAIFSPLNWPYFLWPSGWTLTFRVWLKLLIVATGMYVLAREVLGVSPLSAGLAVMPFTFGAFMTVWLLYPVTATVIWLPWIWWATARLISQPRSRWMAILAIFIALIMLAGHPETAYHMLEISGLFVLFQVWRAGSSRPWQF